MQDIYHIDIAEPGLLERRSWRWLEVRVTGLLEHPCESRLACALGRG